MLQYAMDANGHWYGLMDRPKRHEPARVLIIGAGSRGKTYARAITNLTHAEIVAVAEPVDYKRGQFGQNFIWKGRNEPQPG